MQSNATSTFAAIWMVLSACQSEAPEAPSPTRVQQAAVMTEADKAVVARARARETAQTNLATRPFDFIKGGLWEKHDKGIINSYTQATAIEFTNTSQFEVTDLEGKLTYLNGAGSELATVPFKAAGELPPGATAKLKVTASEVTGKGTKLMVLVERVRIRG